MASGTAVDAAVSAGKDRRCALRRFKPHPVYKDSGIAWLGEIPGHWEVAPVYARYEVALGKMLDAKRVTGEFSGCYLRNVDVQWDAVNTEGLPAMDFAPWERERYLLRPGDLLVCEGGEIGRTAIWRGEIDECFYQKAIHRVRPRSDKEAPRFFYYLMYMLAKRGVFVAGGNPNTIDHLTAVQLRHYRLPFATPQEQRTITAFLDQETARIGALVAKKEQLIALLQEKRTALITRVVTKGLDPNAAMKDSGVEWLGEIPAHWEAIPLKRVASIRYGLGEPPQQLADGLPFIRATNVTKGRIVAREVQFVDPKDVPWDRDPVLRSSDIIVVRSGAYTGDSAIVPAEYDGAIAGYDMVVRPRCSSAARFLAWALLSRYVLEAQIEVESLRAAQPHLNAQELGAVLVLLPPEPEQQAIAAFLDRETAEIDGLVAKAREAVGCLEELRAALISAAVTGKIDVREEAA
jgi:type I restriction enzyme, S subunit